jgi:N-acetyl-anhydromuramyl-L-alanine amidase AmpD
VVEPAGRRKVMVFGSLIVVLSLTSAMLLALEPNPLRPDKPAGLFAVEPRDALDPIFDTHVPTAEHRWKYIYIHHSASASGSALTLAQSAGGLGDHFVIGNGEGSLDGQIEMGSRWVDQLPAAAPPGAKKIDPACISICMIGDFHQNLPTPVQMQRLQQLVSSLQAKFTISADRVLMVTDLTANHSVEIGRYFPVSAFRAQLLK